MDPDLFEVASGRDEGTRFALRGGEALIGRDPSLDIVITDPRVSRRHARVFLDGGLVLIEDLGSTAGTVVNDAHIARPTPLQRADRVRLGLTELVVVWVPEIAETIVTPAVGPPPQQPPADAAAAAPPAPPPPPPALRPPRLRSRTPPSPSRQS